MSLLGAWGGMPLHEAMGIRWEERHQVKFDKKATLTPDVI